MEWGALAHSDFMEGKSELACFLPGVVREQEPENFASEMSGCRKQQQTKVEVSRQETNATAPRLIFRSSL